MSKRDFPGPEFGKGSFANVPKKTHVIQMSPATPAGGAEVNELHSSSSGKASSVFSCTKMRGSSKSSESTDF
eukprot:820251-Ditylum_brightwellii.AAC.1